MHCWRFNTKMSGAAEDCLREGIRFIPVVAETLGGWHKLAVSEIRKRTAAKARHTGQEEKEACLHTAFGPHDEGQLSHLIKYVANETRSGCIWRAINVNIVLFRIVFCTDILISVCV